MIGITQRLEQNKTYYEIRENLSIEWGKLLYDIDFIPLSYSKPFNKYNVNAVIFSGGNDLSIFNPNNLSRIRDEYEKQIIESCVKSKTPILGICRGAQHISHYFGSKIINMSGHINNNHEISIESKRYNVNSYHQYCITSLGNNLEEIAIATDGTIEAFKHKYLPIFGIMWHIERENELSKASKIIWKLFIDSRRKI